MARFFTWLINITLWKSMCLYIFVCVCIYMCVCIYIPYLFIHLSADRHPGSFCMLVTVSDAVMSMWGQTPVSQGTQGVSRSESNFRLRVRKNTEKLNPANDLSKPGSRFPLECPTRAQPTPPWFWLCEPLSGEPSWASLNCEIINGCYFKLLSLW